MSGFVVALPPGRSKASTAVEVSAALSLPDRPVAAVALAHGAGAGMDHPFLTGFAAGLEHAGIATLRFNFPYIEAGRRMPGPASHAVATWEAALTELAQRVPEVPLFAAGKSYGGRMASMAAADGVITPAGLVYLGYPLHPPGDPEKERAAHLPAVSAPQLFVEGSNDPFIQPRERFDAVVATCRDASVIWIDGGGHSFEVKGAKAPAEQIGDALAAPVAAWIRRQRPAA